MEIQTKYCLKAKLSIIYSVSVNNPGPMKQITKLPLNAYYT